MYQYALDLKTAQLNYNIAYGHLLLAKLGFDSTKKYIEGLTEGAYIKLANAQDKGASKAELYELSAEIEESITKGAEKIAAEQKDLDAAQEKLDKASAALEKSKTMAPFMPTLETRETLLTMGQALYQESCTLDQTIGELPAWETLSENIRSIPHINTLLDNAHDAEEKAKGIVAVPHGLTYTAPQPDFNIPIVDNKMQSQLKYANQTAYEALTKAYEAIRLALGAPKLEPTDPTGELKTLLEEYRKLPDTQDPDHGYLAMGKPTHVPGFQDDVYADAGLIESHFEALHAKFEALALKTALIRAFTLL